MIFLSCTLLSLLTVSQALLVYFPSELTRHDEYFSSSEEEVPSHHNPDHIVFPDTVDSDRNAKRWKEYLDKAKENKFWTVEENNPKPVQSLPHIPVEALPVPTSPMEALHPSTVTTVEPTQTTVDNHPWIIVEEPTSTTSRGITNQKNNATSSSWCHR